MSFGGKNVVGEVKKQWDANKERFVHTVGQIINAKWEKQTEAKTEVGLVQQLDRNTKVTLHPINAPSQQPVRDNRSTPISRKQNDQLHLIEMQILQIKLVFSITTCHS